MSTIRSWWSQNKLILLIHQERRRVLHAKQLLFWKTLWSQEWNGLISILLQFLIQILIQQAMDLNCCCIFSRRESIGNDLHEIVINYHLLASLTDLRKFWRWLAWYFKKSISSALFLSSANFFYFIYFSRASFLFLSSSTFSSFKLFFSYSSRIAIASSGAPC